MLTMQNPWSARRHHGHDHRFARSSPGAVQPGLLLSRCLFRDRMVAGRPCGPVKISGQKMEGIESDQGTLCQGTTVQPVVMSIRPMCVGRPQAIRARGLLSGQLTSNVAEVVTGLVHRVDGHPPQ
jgi:hypothetical protein